MGTKRHFRVWRGDSSGGEIQDYDVEVNEGEVVLDIIHRLQATQTPDLACRYRADELALMQSGKTVHQEEPTLHKSSGKIGCSLTTKLSVKDKDGNVIGLMGIARDITPLKDAEKKLEIVHKNLVDAARAAGMAEVAVGVLHNVGNVLNSVNVSAGFICEHLSQSKLASLPKVFQLLHEHAGDIGHYLTKDERGRQLLPYLEKLIPVLQEEQEAIYREAQELDA